MRFNLYLQRKVAWGYEVFGALLILWGALSSGYVLPLIVVGVASIIVGPLVLLVKVCLQRDYFFQEVEVTLTSEGIQRRRGTETVHVTWDMVNRVHESKHMWIFIAEKRTRIAVNKQALSQEQRAELSDFIAGLPRAVARRLQRT